MEAPDGSWVAWLKFPADPNQCPPGEQSPSQLAPVVGGAVGSLLRQPWGVRADIKVWESYLCSAEFRCKEQQVCWCLM